MGSFYQRNKRARQEALPWSGAWCWWRYWWSWWATSDYPAADRSCAEAKIAATDLITLAPGEPCVVVLDLAELRWHLRSGEAVLKMGALNNFTHFRIEYQAPPPVDGAETDSLWLGRMPSRAFNANGFVD